MKRTFLTLGLSAMLAMPMLAVAQLAPTTPGTGSEMGYDRSGSSAGMEHHRQQAMGAEQVRSAQKQLKEAGFNPGPVDGQLGRQTSRAIREFQQDNGLPATGRLDEPTKELLMAQTTQPSSERLDPLPGSSPGRSMGDEPSGAGRNPSTLGGSGTSR